MKFALAIFGTEEQYVSKESAINGGRCNLCGELLAKHPRDKHGQLAIDRHHQINIAFAEVYKTITGWDYPEDETNLYWVGRGCHEEFHNLLDPTIREVGVIIKEKRLKPHFSAKDQKRYLRRLTRLCDKFVSTVGPLEYGKGFLNNPAPLPEHMVR